MDNEQEKIILIKVNDIIEAGTLEIDWLFIDFEEKLKQLFINKKQQHGN